jgi:RP/EB family microtubule-associated protein
MTNGSYCCFLFASRSDYEFVNNYKLLQAAFTKNNVLRHVDVDKLIRAKYQDNLEFCQWLKAFYDQSGGSPRDGYDAKAVRAKGKGGKKYNELMAKGGAGGKRTMNSSNVRSRPVPATSPKVRVPARPTRPDAATNKKPLKTNSSSENKSVSNNGSDKTSIIAASAQADAQILKKNVELENKVRELESTISDIEKERDFYFGKLRNVELMLQVKQDKNYEECEIESVVDSIFKVLYATADEDVAVDEDGEVRGFDA